MRQSGALHEVREAARHVAALGQQRAKVVVCLGMLGVKRQRAFERRSRVVEPTCGGQRDAARVEICCRDRCRLRRRARRHRAQGIARETCRCGPREQVRRRRRVAGREQAARVGQPIGFGVGRRRPRRGEMRQRRADLPALREDRPEIMVRDRVIAVRQRLGIEALGVGAAPAALQRDGALDQRFGGRGAHRHAALARLELQQALGIELP